MINETAWMAGDALHFATRLNAERHVYRLSLLHYCFFLFYYLCQCIKTNGKKLRHSRMFWVFFYYFYFLSGNMIFNFVPALATWHILLDRHPQLQQQARQAGQVMAQSCKS